MKNFSNFDMLQNQSWNIIGHKATDAPTNPVHGQYWYNANDFWNIPMYWDATRNAWLSLETITYSFDRNSNMTLSQYLRTYDSVTSDQAPHVVCRNAMLVEIAYVTRRNSNSTASVRTINLSTQTASGNLLTVSLGGTPTKVESAALQLQGPVGLAVYATAGKGKNRADRPAVHLFVKYCYF